MAHVNYEKRQITPSCNRIVFFKEQGNIISENIKITFKIRLNKLVPKPIARIQLMFEMLYPRFYEFLDNGSTHTIEYTNKSADFESGEITLRVKILNPLVQLEREVIFKAIVMDVDEGIPFPLGGNYGFYSWEPVPPPTESLLNNIPNELI